LIARINQKLNGRVGFVNPQLYALAATSGAFHDITVGDNRVSFQQFNNVGYDAGQGWDPTSGLGSPDGTALSNLLQVGSTGPATISVSVKARKAGARRKVRSGAAPTRSKQKLRAEARG
jgi:hypothetical protein